VHTIRLANHHDDEQQHSQHLGLQTYGPIDPTAPAAPRQPANAGIQVTSIDHPNLPNNNIHHDNIPAELPSILTYDTSKFLYPPAPIAPSLLLNFVFNLLPSFNWFRVPQVSHKIDCVETYCARPRVDWPHFWRSRIIYWYAFNPGYDEDLMHFRHRLILVFAIMIFNLCIFMSFSGALERVVANLLYIVSSTPLNDKMLDWVAFWLTANFAQSFVVVMACPFLSFAMFDCENFKRSYKPHVRVLGWTIYIFLCVTGLAMFGGAIGAFALVLYTHRCDFILESLATFFFSSHLFSISCVWGIPLPILYTLMMLYGAVPRQVTATPEECKAVTEPRHLDPNSTNHGEYGSASPSAHDTIMSNENTAALDKDGFEPIINKNDAVQGIDLHTIKRLFVQAGVAIGDYNGEMVLKSSRPSDDVIPLTTSSTATTTI
jgi:hypothetical protein